MKPRTRRRARLLQRFRTHARGGHHRHGLGFTSRFARRVVSPRRRSESPPRRRRARWRRAGVRLSHRHATAGGGMTRVRAGVGGRPVLYKNAVDCLRVIAGGRGCGRCGSARRRVRENFPAARHRLLRVRDGQRTDGGGRTREVRRGNTHGKGGRGGDGVTVDVAEGEIDAFAKTRGRAADPEHAKKDTVRRASVGNPTTSRRVPRAAAMVRFKNRYLLAEFRGTTRAWTIR